MGKTFTTLINRFDRGMTNDFRDEDKRFARRISHFDILSEKSRLIPLRSMEAETGTPGDTEKLCKFLSTYDDAAATVKQYALGVTEGTSQPAIFSRASLPAGAWATDGNKSLGTAGARSENMFFFYHGNLIYARNGSHIGRFALANDSHFETAMALTWTGVGQGLVHSKDNLAYFPYYVTASNITTPYIGRFTTGFSLTAQALIMPTEFLVSDICEYGNNIAVGLRSKGVGGRSVVYIWNRDATLATLSESIDWGNENLHMIEELDGELIGLSSSDVSGTNFAPKLIFKRWASGVGAIPFLTITLGPTTSLVTYGPSTGLHTQGLISKQKRNNRIYFMMSCEVDGVQLDGVFSIGRSEEGSWVFSLDRLLNNDTAITSAQPMGFDLLGDYMTVAYKDNSVYSVRRTNNDGNFSATSIIESVIFNNVNDGVNVIGGDSSIFKKLEKFTIMTKPLAAGEQVVVKLKKDEETSFATTVLTHSTDDKISKTAVNDSTGSTLPEYQELTIRIESIGGAEVTGYKLESSIVDGKENT